MSSKFLPGVLLLAGGVLGYAAPRSAERDRWDYLVGLLRADELATVTSRGDSALGIGHAEGVDSLGRDGWEYAGSLGQTEHFYYVLWKRRL